MNRFILIFFSLSFLLFSCSIDSRPLAVRGVLDLSSRDFNKYKKLSLAGEWEFYWDELLEPDESGIADNPKRVTYINVPSNWRYYCLFNGIQFHAHGRATYRLKLILSESPEDLVLYTPHILLSFRIFLNSTEIVQDTGISAATGELDMSRRYFNYYNLDTDQSSFFLTIQVQNPEKTGTPVSGGIYKDIFLGKRSALEGYTYIRAVLAGIGAGACFIMFLYHLFMVLKSRKKWINTFLSLMCLTMGFMITFFNADFIAFGTINHFSRAYYDFEKFFFLLEYIILVLIIQYFRYLYNGYISGRMFIGFTFICFLLSGFILFLPPFPGLILVKSLLTILIGGYFVIKSFRIFFLQNDDSLWGFPVSFILFYLTVLFDMAVSVFTPEMHVIFFRVSYPGFLVFLLINTYYIAARDYKISGKKADTSLIAGENNTEHAGALQSIKDLRFAKDLPGATNIHNINKKLKEQDTGKSGFFVNASHELRTPLTVIRLSVDEILKKASGQAVPVDHPVFLRIQRQCDKLLRYVNNILDFSSLELNIKEVQMSRFDMKVLITFFVSEIASMVLSRNLTLAFTDTLKEKAIVLLDFRLFETAFFNIISNAFKYTPAGGRIGIHLERKPGSHEVELSITDTGMGIPGDDRETIFSWYSKVDGNLDKKKEGMGIGLAVTRKIIEFHGGNIKLESTDGTGSTFSIVLPCAGGTDSVELNFLSYPLRKELLSGLASVHFPVQGTSENRANYMQTILIIDDEPDLLGFLNEVLTPDYTIFTANNGVEGISVLKNGKPDLIITDIMMPEMDGFEFVREIQDDYDCHDIPILFLTAKSGIEDKLKGLSTGAIDYICKPFTIEELKLKIKNVLLFQAAQKDRLKKRIMDAIYEKDRGGKHIDYQVVLKRYSFAPREEEVFSGLARGLSNKEIGMALNISEATVKRSVSGVYKKMGVNNRLEFLNKLNEELNR